LTAAKGIGSLLMQLAFPAGQAVYHAVIVEQQVARHPVKDAFMLRALSIAAAA
jgi:hypothetical protein